MTRDTTPDELRELLEKATKTESGCLEWSGSRNHNGYGTVYFRGRTTSAHRAVLQLVEGRTLGRWEFACHRCDNPPCINPEHLFVGSPGDNARDMASKGRNYREKLPEHRERLSASVRAAVEAGRLETRRGEAVTSAKLSSAQVLAIRADPRPQTAIAADYGVSQPLIGGIKRRKYWAHV